MHKCESWLQKLYRSALRRAPVEGQPRPPARPVDPTIQLSEIASPGISELRSLPDWHTIVRQGCPVTLSWDGGPKRGTITVQGTVRLTFEEAVWIWLDEQLPEGDRPALGQAMHVHAPSQDALRLIPCQLVDEGHGSSLQVTVSGRLSRVQRRRDVRARVELPPVSAVRLGPSGAPTGLLGLDVMDLSAGGLRARADEPLAAGDKVRLVLRLDSGQPLMPVMEVLIGGQLARGRFCPMPERERRRIVQYVYRQELAERQRVQAASPAE
jgi:c-di-GMP-binding flagellar brake protein YcgR